MTIRPSMIDVSATLPFAANTSLIPGLIRHRGRSVVDGNYPVPVNNKRAPLKIGPGRVQGQNHAVTNDQAGHGPFLSLRLSGPDLFPVDRAVAGCATVPGSRTTVVRELASGLACSEHQI
jgi:hypothetical protein